MSQRAALLISTAITVLTLLAALGVGVHVWRADAGATATGTVDEITGPTMQTSSRSASIASSSIGSRRPTPRWLPAMIASPACSTMWNSFRHRTRSFENGRRGTRSASRRQTRGFRSWDRSPSPYGHQP